jgi:hypothetical protein
MLWKRGRQAPGTWRRTIGLLPVYIGFVLLKLWLVASQPILAIGGAANDDGLFLNLANSLSKGQWLGTYNVLTLTKGCFYSIWITLVSRLSIPLLLSQHLLYLAAVAAFVLAIRPALPRPKLLLLLFALLWFNPGSYCGHVLRIMREGIYPALTLLVVAGTVGILVRLEGPVKHSLRWMLGTGVVFAAFWQTREEGVWLLPCYAVVMAWAVVKLWRNHHPRKWWLALMCFIPLVMVMSGNLVVSGINRAKYGVFASVEFKADDFLSAYGSLSRVKPKPWQSHVLVTKETRERIYAVSPAFAQLRPLLEGALGRGWSNAGGTRWPSKNSEIGGGWFMWALRDAVARAGYHSSGKKAMAYYRRLADEIDAACADGRLECFPARASMMAPWRREFNEPFVEAMAKAVPFLASFTDISATPSPSMGSDASLGLYRELTHNRIAPVPPVPNNWLGGKVNAFKIDTLNAILAVYQKIMPILAVLALAAFFLRMILGLKCRRLSNSWIVQTALLGSIVVRLTILSIIEVTSFPGIDPLYLSSAYPLLIAFIFLAMQENALVALRFLGTATKIIPKREAGA